MSDQVSIEVIETTVTVEVVEEDGVQVVEVIHPGPQGVKGEPGPPKAITIARPQVSDEFTLFYTQSPTTITQALGVVRGVTPSVTFEIRYDANRAAAGAVATVATAITNTTTGQAVTIQNMPIPADRYVWIKVLAVDGIVDELNVSVEL
jgi:hypothetical protein